MSRYRTDSLFADVDRRFSGNDKGVVYNHIIRVAFESAADAEFDYGVPGRESKFRSGEETSLKPGFVSKRMFRLTSLSLHAVQDVS
jgi:hypothetical protein